MADTITFAGRRISLPGSKPVRITIGVALTCLGFLGFLPVIGFWMIPLGVLVLSYDLHLIRRARRRLVVWWGRRRTGTTRR